MGKISAQIVALIPQKGLPPCEQTLVDLSEEAIFVKDGGPTRIQGGATAQLTCLGFSSKERKIEILTNKGATFSFFGTGPRLSPSKVEKIVIGDKGSSLSTKWKTMATLITLAAVVYLIGHQL